MASIDTDDTNAGPAARPGYVTRRPGAVKIAGHVAGDARELKRLIAGFESRRVVVADLSLGAWRPNQLAHEIAPQIGLTLDDPASGDRGRTQAVDSASVGRWIDAEAEGDSATRAGLAMASRISARLMATAPMHGRAIILVLAPRFGLPWGRENLALLRYLAEAAAPFEFGVVLVAAGPPTQTGDEFITASWQPMPSTEASAATEATELALVPGVVDVGVSEAVGGANALDLKLASGQILIAPERRAPPADATASAMAALENADRPRWLRTYARYWRCLADGVVMPLIAASWAVVGAGGADIALRLMERCAQAAIDAQQRAAADHTLQSLRLIQQRYDDMAAQPDPTSDTPPYTAEKLRQLKAWGCVMAGRPKDAHAYMDAALNADHFSDDPLMDLYLRNITALIRFRNGDLDGALALEADIELRIEEHSEPLWHLRYLNAINTARLMHSAGRLEDSAAYYRQAFAVTDGVRIPHETFYTSLCWARLSEAQGDRAEAFRHLLHAGLHWTANPTPETLGWRAAAAAVKQRTAHADPEAISAALADQIALAANKQGVTTAPVGAARREIVHSSLAGTMKLNVTGALGGPGWGVLTSDDMVPAPPFDGPERTRLVAVLLGALDTMASGAEFRTAIIDDCGGRCLPETLAELAVICVCRGGDRLAFGEEVWTLTAAARTALLHRMEVAVGPGVDRVNGSLVHFKRFLAPVALNDTEIAILDAVGRGGCLFDICVDPADAERICNLHRRKILALSCDDASLTVHLNNVAPIKS